MRVVGYLLSLAMLLSLCGCACFGCQPPYCPAKLACCPPPDSHCPPPPTYTTNGPSLSF